MLKNRVIFIQILPAIFWRIQKKVMNSLVLILRIIFVDTTLS